MAVDLTTSRLLRVAVDLTNLRLFVASLSLRMTDIYYFASSVIVFLLWRVINKLVYSTKERFYCLEMAQMLPVLLVFTPFKFLFPG